MKRLGSGLALVALALVLAAPAQALPRDEGGWAVPRMVKAIKELVVRAFGDGLIIPRP